ncbi:MAG: HNH endonuclease signature motif containing protein [Phycisphaeraceae bacterium]
MSFSYISAQLRRLVTARADGICEYCLLAEADTFYGCQADHIISEKHGGATEADNLALACVFCNQAKGSDIGSMHWNTNTFTRFFNPRTDAWADHFELVDGHIEGLTPIGSVTALILSFNSAERILERQALRAMSRYPSPAALKRLLR